MNTSTDAVALVLILVVSFSASSTTSEVTTSARSQTGHGHLEGVVRFVGDQVPRPTRVQNTTDPAVCGATKTLDDLVVSPGNKGIQDVIVALADVPKDKIPNRQPDKLTLDNRGCRFVPHTGVVTVGSTITVRNSDPVFHTVHFYGLTETNISLFKGDTVPWVARRPGLVIVRCDVHGWMRAFIRVDEHPFHAVTNSRGSFRIENIPAGTYQLEVWHEKLGEQKKTARIEAGKTVRIELEYSLNQ
jgi:plastocyanin